MCLGVVEGEGRGHTFNEALLEGSEFAEGRDDLTILVVAPGPLKRLSSWKHRMLVGGEWVVGRRGSLKRLLKRARGDKWLFDAALNHLFSSNNDAISLLKNHSDFALHILHEEFHVLHLNLHDASHFSNSFNLETKVLGDGGVLQLCLEIDKESYGLVPVQVGTVGTDDDQIADELKVLDRLIHLIGNAGQGGGEVVEIGAHDRMVEIHTRRELVLEINELDSGGIEGRVEGDAVVDALVEADNWGSLLSFNNGVFEWNHHEPGEDAEGNGDHRQHERIASRRSLLGFGGVLVAASRISIEDKRSGAVTYDFSRPFSM